MSVLPSICNALGASDEATKYVVAEINGKWYVCKNSASGPIASNAYTKEEDAQKYLSNLKSNGVAKDEAKFMPGDYVMSKTTGLLGVVVESSGGKTKVRWTDTDTTSTVNTSDLKG